MESAGHSESGKSTLVSRLKRFCDGSDGMILLGDVDLRSMCVQTVRRQFSVTP